MHTSTELFQCVVDMEFHSTQTSDLKFVSSMFLLLYIILLLLYILRDEYCLSPLR